MVTTILLTAFLGRVNLEPIDPALAKRYFQEAKWASDDDGGKLWGKSLYGPMVFVDSNTREAVLNEKPPIEAKSPLEGVYTLKLPDNITVANTAFDWGGKKWTMVMWPLPSNRGERARLMIHELWHRIQDSLGLPASSPQNAHMDAFNGRLWLQLEVIALSKALTDQDGRAPHLRNALLFRAYRQSLFSGAKEGEDALEMNEGLAEYTGIALKGAWQPEARLWHGQQLLTYLNRDSYSRSFAYRTGAAYALLDALEESVAGKKESFRQSLSAKSSLADVLAAQIGYKPEPTERAAIDAAKEYGYDKLLAQEIKREEVRKANEAKYQKQLIDGPVIVIDMKTAQLSFDPYNVFTFGDRGTLYPTATIIGDWGTLDVTDGALISKDYSTGHVAAPTTADHLKGQGWTLKMNPGWTLVPAERKGDFKFVKG